MSHAGHIARNEGRRDFPDLAADDRASTRCRLDLCCGGIHPLAFVAQKHGFSLEKILEELNAEITGAPSATKWHCGQLPLGEIFTCGETLMSEITKQMSVAEIVKQCPTARRVLDKYGLKGCGGAVPHHYLEDGAAIHGTAQLV